MKGCSVDVDVHVIGHFKICIFWALLITKCYCCIYIADYILLLELLRHVSKPSQRWLTSMLTRLPLVCKFSFHYCIASRFIYFL